MSSTTGAWLVASQGLEPSLADLNRWRFQTAAALADYRRWATVSRLMDDHTAARLAHLERRLATERLTISFVAEFSRGKSELINALFFADLGTRLLPSGVGRTTLCPAELVWDPERPPSIRLLPIHTRESPKALREFIAELDTWEVIDLDPRHPESVAAACQVLSHSLEVPAAEAANLGLTVDGGEMVEIPKYRYAVINFPHPILKTGLTILDTPGHNTMGAEPEITMHRVPDSAAIVFMLGADTGVTATDRDLWVQHIAPIEGVDQTCFIVLNKIDGLRDGMKSETQVLSEIDRQVRSTAEALGVEPTRVFGLSARQALVAKIHSDRDGVLKSRLYRLEQALARGMVHQRRLDHAASVRAELKSVFGESLSLIDSRHAFATQQVDDLVALQGRNQKLVEALSRKASGERSRLEQARAVMMGLRTIHNRNMDELTRLFDPNAVREAGIRARMAVLNSPFSAQIGEVLDQYFEMARGRVRSAVPVIADARAMMLNVSRRFSEEFQMPTVEVPEFATERFLVEFDRIEERCQRDFKSPASLVLRRRSTLGALFFDTVALKVIHVFEIADREVRTWMHAFIRPLDAHIQDYQEQTNTRIEGMARIQDAETDLVARMEELQRLADEVGAQRGEWEKHRERLEALLEVPREHSLA